MRVARHVLSIAASVVAVAALVLGIAVLALVALDASPHGIARAETAPEDPAPDADFGARGSILDEAEPFPIEGLYNDKNKPGDENAPPHDSEFAEPNPEPEPAEPEQRAGPVDTSARFQAVYNVSLGRFNLGNFSISGTVQNGQYSLRGNGTFSVLKGWVFNWQGRLHGSGEATTDGANPRSYSFSQSDGKYQERLSIDFGDGYVQSVKIWPKPRPYPGEIKVTKEQVQRVVDPLSGAFLTARSNDTRANLSVCNQVIPVFDGRSRYDLVLKPKKRVMVQNRGKGNYSGPAAVCQVKFVPISGYPRGDPGIEELRQAGGIEAWLVPLRGTGMYVPYQITIPAFGGYTAVAVATSMRVGRAGRAEAR
ncbi:DUF3108 domain-containing protein [Methyloceanibacter stevinii]|uniref:DUF3108 domain-containing protein n=1 Tax=Methyloceanibacter stevinii TaxID=1774970 RepID=UPI0009F331DB|nr:DUF3108 domain-containing protein [Methyloceanibacter stevinii]